MKEVVKVRMEVRDDVEFYGRKRRYHAFIFTPGNDIPLHVTSYKESYAEAVETMRIWSNNHNVEIQP